MITANSFAQGVNDVHSHIITPEFVSALETEGRVMDEGFPLLHPHRPEPVNRQVMQQTPLAMQEYLSETTRAVSNMISRNVLARYNNIKVVPIAAPICRWLFPA